MTTIQCRYLKDNGEQCTEPAINSDIIDICARHASQVLLAIRNAVGTRDAANLVFSAAASQL